MKKIFLIISVLFLITTFRLNAQITEALDFTVTDIDGVEHNLFTYLDDGQFVYIYFFMDGC
jgi:hypothetical protein